MKKKILESLYKTKDFVSGEAISEKLGCSRTIIWKVIKELRTDGYDIESSSKKGYKLASFRDVINTFEIKKGLHTNFLGSNIIYFNEIDSTNDAAKQLAAQGAAEGTLVVANSQNNGRGRLGRTWSTFNNKNIAMSLVLRPQIEPQAVQIITLAAAVAIIKAIKECCGIEAGIKWPNDIILDNKKVCGILTEMSCEMDSVGYVVLGIGLNVNQRQEEFQDILQEIAISLKIFNEKQNASKQKLTSDGDFFRADLINYILLEFEEVYNWVKNGDEKKIINEWKEYSVTLGKFVRAYTKDSFFEGIAKDISADGRLIIEDDKGNLREVLSGEVVVKGILGVNDKPLNLGGDKIDN